MPPRHEGRIRVLCATAALLALGCRTQGEPEPGGKDASAVTRTAMAGQARSAPETQPAQPDYPLRVYEPLFPGEHAYEGLTWNQLYQEPGESFEAYMFGYSRGTAIRTIRIWPLQTPDRRTARALQTVRDYLAIAFSSDVRVMDVISPPPGSYNTHFGQYDANAVLNGMIRDPSIDHVGQLNVAVTSSDLYAGQRAYVFGYADYVKHVGVLSTHRLGSPGDASLIMRRLVKLARHEVAHMYGMAHCTDPSCVMRGAIKLDEADSIPLHMCPSCAAKLAWRIGDDGRERNEALEDFYREHFSRFLQGKMWGLPARGD